MGWVGTGITFIISWWMVFFMVLPWGVRRQDDPEPGHEAGAPENPRLWLKVAVTTGIAVVITALAWVAVDLGWISIRDSV
jgi:predicted secreted protein